MKYQHRKPAVLLLEDGTWFEGYSIGKQGTTTGELCFNTGMTGYQEIFTDPSYYGQIMVTTHTHIGNYGVHRNDYESDSAKIAGLVVNIFSQDYSRKDAVESLQAFLEKNNVVGISDIDTRKLVRHIRDKGVMNGIISSEISDTISLKTELSACPPMAGLELSSEVTTSEPYFMGDPNSPFKVAALDLGIKQNILRMLASRGCYVQVFPAKTTADEIRKFNANGYFISNGPGDPAAMPYAVNTVAELQEDNIPLFGICLGHQVLALANDASTFKMFNGHRGINHPVKNLVTGKSEMTSQNHGFAVDMTAASDNDKIEVTHKNLNDNTLEGIRIRNRKAFSVQYHPEASPGPHDSRYLFDDFVRMMEEDRG